MREQLMAAETVTGIEWRDGVLHLLDQRLLPLEQCWLACTEAAEVAEAISDMAVRGAPAIGICAAYGLVLALRRRLAEGESWEESLEEDFMILGEARPTPANLFWALNRMRERLQRLRPDEDVLKVMEAEAVAIHQSDREANLTMAQFGVEQIRRHQGSEQALLTHGNAGALATGGFGTALGVIRAATLEGMVEQVYACESRPWLQGSRLTAWELAADGVPVTVVADAAAGHLMKTKGITWVVVGADCIAANGDVAAKIGTYQMAVAAMHHGLRFMVVAPSTSIDLNLPTGEDIPLETRGEEELLEVAGIQVTADVEAYNPVVDVTPADLIDVIVTERGVVERPDTAKIAQLMCRKRLH
ncbi:MULTISPECIES: S-methyl-5-thioribose-1-phosphate isomerase [unclassified Pseudomonas]|uniref:S-methyl-5-thioribose-1-phosphate isomerase n=1 Tax=unclassified Pseudomonas TaxID=196821 RepID=UPI000C88726D|nr:MULTISPECIES: S-methyl-5-thioribose-1-phosphate isomerase [unclassified Pseudomonas]PMZ93594.1 S-methyl-5-thioribose-1-phosphate isomerase [Pseudomonas sp. FW305-42]PNA24676.1 S-methyl-5-thioribose-1-phosphate isomerase [Pseudomonas sp. MPR-R1B]PNB22737.1 S-methyl-5-thioribose-1-phosphate isomerase [Pseudomonas sp. DP16D-E2]PNB43247.1 S-methyl-5-thioribose-1-phosphate isomerase [Pseudomonas sp. FW305-17]PNB57296.1 S-methyl-5-thioribose-1-phosphate isomerase [Pseudomonas sp. GW531-E2]